MPPSGHAGGDGDATPDGSAPDRGDTTPRGDVAAGARAVAPILLGVVPFGLVAGVAAVEAGLTPVQAVGMSVLMFAGASQLAAIELIGETAPLAVVVLTAVVINLRFVMYSASIAPYLRRAGAPARALGAYVLTDQAYALSVTEFRSAGDRHRTAYYLGAALPLWVVWQVATAAGAVLGAGLPENLSLEFAVPLTFMALLFPAVEDRPTAVAAAVAGGVGVVAAPLPLNLGLVTAAVAGVGAGVLAELRAGAFPTTDDDGDVGDGGGHGPKPDADAGDGDGDVGAEGDGDTDAGHDPEAADRQTGGDRR